MSSPTRPGDGDGAIADRKDEHLDVCLEESTASGRPHGLARWRLAYRALPELALDDVDLTTELAGKTLAAPLIIGAMTGGTPRAGRINRALAEAAQARGVGLALGSGRIALEQPETAASFQVRDLAPDVLLFANLGAVQLNYGVTGDDAQRLVEILEADALNLHLNPLQEAIQERGDTNFRDLTTRIAEALPAIQVPVFVKEVGAGIDRISAGLLAELPIAGVETAGVGGTSWARIEALRAEGALAREAGIALEGFGIPTAESVIVCREALPDRPVIASGGLRTAEEMATCLALGADAVACAGPFLEAADRGGAEAVCARIDALVHTLRVLCFVCGAASPHDLRGRVGRVAP